MGLSLHDPDSYQVLAEYVVSDALIQAGSHLACPSESEFIYDLDRIRAPHNTQESYFSQLRISLNTRESGSCLAWSERL